MNKTEFVKSVAAESGLPVKDAALAVKAMQTVVVRSMHRGESVIITGFGTFSVREYKARTGRNPRTGEKLDIAAKNGVRFTPGNALDLTGIKVKKIKK